MPNRGHRSGPAHEPQGAVVAEPAAPHYLLCLFIAGPTPRSAQAVVNVRRLCEEHLSGRHELRIVDLSQQPELAVSNQIVAAPTLVKELPLPRRRFIGDMSRVDRLLAGLDLFPTLPSGAKGDAGS